MLCDQCFLRNALVHITNIRGGSITIRHLCQDCAVEEPFNLMRLGEMMKGLVFLIEGSPETRQKALPKQQQQKDLECAQCYYRLSDLKKTQRVGCPACYEFFKEFIISKVIKPKDLVPSSTPKELAVSSEKDHLQETPAGEWELLQSRLYQALKQEDYEEAARLRDRLRQTLDPPPVELRSLTPQGFDSRGDTSSS
jgi:protein arginine kinase activator